jgi:hypothetical protein
MFMNTRDFLIFVVRYADNVLNDQSMTIAICMSEISEKDNRFLACECTKSWGKLGGIFPEADVDLLKRWCESVRREFCSQVTNRMIEERLEGCSSNIDVSISRKTLDARSEPATEMEKLILEHLS